MKWMHAIPAMLALFATAKLRAGNVVVTAFGAKGDSTTLNTAAIQQAVDACSKSGGGKVIFPAGKYLTGTIVLKDLVTLHLEKGAAILGSTSVDDYQNLDPFNDGLGTAVGWALVVAVDAHKIGIEGAGMIDGQGPSLKARQAQADNRPEGQRWGRRPFLLRMVRCADVRITGISLRSAAAWTSHYFQCRRLHIEKLKILSRGVAHNDGIDIDGCQDVRIRDCDIVSGDDALCFKTTSSKMACSRIRVSGMRLKSNQGAIKMGTESMAPFEDIKISHCYIYDTNNGGIKLLSVDGAHLRHVVISDIKMVNVKTPILVRLGARLSVFRKEVDEQQAPGTIDDVIIRNVQAQAADSAQLQPASGILITGVPGHAITRLTLENIDIELPGGGTAEQARQAVPEAVDKYPEVKTFGPRVPAYGLWARHVAGLSLKNLSFHLKRNDLRPAIVCEDGQDIEIDHCHLPETNGAEAIVRFGQVSRGIVKDTEVRGSAAALVFVEGRDSRDIRTEKNRAPGMAKQIFLADGVPASAAVPGKR